MCRSSPSTPASAAASFRTALPVVPLDVAVSAEPGHPDRSSAPAAVASIRRAVADVMAGAASAVVTNPVAKNVLYNWGFAEPGHTEFLAKLVQEATGKSLRPVMMLWSPELAVVPVTIHLPLKEIFKQLSTELIVETGRIVARDLSQRFGLRHPRLVVAGLNPHAGEAGTLGEEDERHRRARRSAARRRRHRREGAAARRLLFHERARATYDAALCMYHDQALIPIKTLAFDHAVNVTLGLPFVRTSPDHGTAFDIAGTGSADPASLIAALRLAKRLAVGSAGDRRAPAGIVTGALDSLPPLRDVIRRHGLTARKSLGQNFLFDLNLAARIARAAGPLAGVTVFEVGPGPGGLTRALLALGAARVIAVERDDRAIAALQEIAALYPDRLDHCGRGCADLRPGAASAPGSDAHRRQSALQHRDGAPCVLAQRRALAAVVRIRRSHVPARGRRAHRLAAGIEKLRAAVRSCAVALRSAHHVRRERLGVRAAAESHVLDCAHRAARNAAALRSQASREGHAGGVRTTAQNAAPEPAFARHGYPGSP